jgi:hypothetical protein
MQCHFVYFFIRDNLHVVDIKDLLVVEELRVPVGPIALLLNSTKVCCNLYSNILL